MFFLFHLAFGLVKVLEAGPHLPGGTCFGTGALPRNGGGSKINRRGKPRVLGSLVSTYRSGHPNFGGVWFFEPLPNGSMTPISLCWGVMTTHFSRVMEAPGSAAGRLLIETETCYVQP